MSEDEAVAAAWRETAPDAVLLDGFHALKHALRFGADVRLVLTSDMAAVRALSESLASDITDRLGSIAREVPAKVLRELVPRAHPTGIAALATRPSTQANMETLNRLPRPTPIVVLDNPRNLGNVGAVIRLAAGFDATGVITTGDADPWHPNAVRASAGLHFATAVERLDPAGLPRGPLYVLDPEGEDIRSTVLPDDALLVFGSERHGVSAQLRDQATKLLAVPMRPQVSSFNLATSVAMGLFHWMSTTRHPSPRAGA